MSQARRAGRPALSPTSADLTNEQDPASGGRGPNPLRLLGLVAAAAVMQACLLLWMLAGELQARPTLFLGSYAICFACYGVLWWYGRGCFPGRVAFWIVFAVALIFRATLLPAQPGLSDDIYRYVWDGKMQHAGINPYAYAPEDPELLFLRDDHWESINHKSIPTIYPPVMQAFFAAAYRVSVTPVGFKLLFVLCDLGVLGLLWWLASGLKVEAWNIALYAWNPLVLLEVAGSGHNDVVALLFLIGALGLILGRRRLLASMAVAGAILAKIFPAFLLATFVRRIPSRVLWPLPLLLVAGFLPYTTAGWRVSEGLSTYGHYWQHNDVAFRWVLAATEWVQPQRALTAVVDFVRGLFADTEALSFLYDYTQPRYVARVVSGLVILAIAVFVSFRPWHPTRESLVTLAALLLLSPTVHPWYLLWFAPLLALHPSRGLLLWTALVPLSYFLAVADPSGDPPGGWLLYVEYLPVLMVLAWEFRRSRRRGLPEPGCLP